MANPCLLIGAALSAVAALLHVGCINFGATWYPFLGAGERAVRLLASGSIFPPVVAAGIAVVLALWSLYAFSATGVIPPLPLMRLALCGITGIYLSSGVAGLTIALSAPGRQRATFWLWSSIIYSASGRCILSVHGRFGPRSYAARPNT